MGKVFFVGAGPGDPELLTLKGKRLIEKADVIVYTGSLISREILDLAPRAKIYDSSGMHLEEIVQILIREAREGKVVVRLHDGDPTIFGAIFEQMVRLEEAGLPYEIVPGVSSVFAAAASMKTELTIPELTQTVILTRLSSRTPMPPREKLSSLASHGCTLACYLSVALIDRVVRELKEAGCSDDLPVAVVYRASCADEKIILGTIEDIVQKVREARISAQALILVGRAFDPKLKLDGLRFRSKLYNQEFSHSFRRKVKAPSPAVSENPAEVKDQNA